MIHKELCIHSSSTQCYFTLSLKTTLTLKEDFLFKKVGYSHEGVDSVFTVCEVQLCNTACILIPVCLHLRATFTPPFPSVCLPHPPTISSFLPSLNTVCLLTSCSDFSRKPIVLPRSYPFFMTQFQYPQL